MATPHQTGSPTAARHNIEQLRGDIDSGRTGDKVDYGDPAAAPLGADEEASGQPVGSAEVHRARVQERASAQLHGQARAASTTATSQGTKSKTWLYAALAAAAVVVLLLFGTMMTPGQ